MSEKILVNRNRLLGALAKWSVQQIPYHRPENLEVVLDKVSSNTENYFAQGELGYVEFESMGKLVRFLEKTLRAIPEYVAWNDRKNGNSSDLKFVSRFDGDGDSDDDFIDLDALERNIAAECVGEY